MSWWSDRLNTANTNSCHPALFFPQQSRFSWSCHPALFFPQQSRFSSNCNSGPFAPQDNRETVKSYSLIPIALGKKNRDPETGWNRFMQEEKKRKLVSRESHFFSFLLSKALELLEEYYSNLSTAIHSSESSLNPDNNWFPGTRSSWPSRNWLKSSRHRFSMLWLKFKTMNSTPTTPTNPPKRSRHGSSGKKADSQADYIKQSTTISGI